MGLFKLMFGVAKKMDKEREKEFNRKLKHQKKQDQIEQQQNQTRLLQLVVENITEMVSTQEEWSDSYNFKNQALDYIGVDGIDESDVDKYFAVIDDIVHDTKTAYEKIKRVADVVEVHEVTQEYLKSIKEHMLLQLEYMIKHYIGVKNYVQEYFNKGFNEEYIKEVINEDYRKSESHAEICQSYINKAVQSIQNL
ncbi:hypothetical protein D4T97_015610 [Siminovitchia acidinfaciens]|uniref:Uncharacterized protein n=1 Tax=Siminovitchia acidinfaciens TaxID=2321395 RepID=A0A429XVU1_9BACI|nr:hypothetical protein [Siminovitchia acidinfaciens]RST72487.1 hypothetical protein D4T97_015610 [Siminovitchia acidinfaciens]